MQRKKREEKAAKSSSSITPSGQESELAKIKGKLTNDEVADYIRKKEIKTFDELLADAETRRLDGDRSLIHMSSPNKQSTLLS